MSQLDLFKKPEIVKKKPPFRVTQKLVDGLRELLKDNGVEFVSYTDDDRIVWRWSSTEMKDGKYEIFIVDFEQLANVIYGAK